MLSAGFVTKKPIRRDTMMPVFQAISLYNRTDAVRTDETNDILLEEDVSYCVHNFLEQRFSKRKVTGKLHSLYVSKAIEDELSNNNASLLCNIVSFTMISINPQLLLTRADPLCLHMNGRPWVRRIPHTSSDDFS